MLAQHADETGQAFTDDAQRLILRRDTHIDDLANKLREERVRRVIEPILAGADETECSAEDLSYVRDLGLVAAPAQRRSLSGACDAARPALLAPCCCAAWAAASKPDASRRTLRHHGS